MNSHRSAPSIVTRTCITVHASVMQGSTLFSVALVLVVALQFAFFSAPPFGVHAAPVPVLNGTVNATTNAVNVTYFAYTINATTTTLRVGTCITTTSSKFITVTYQIAKLNTSCGFIRTDCSNSNTGVCLGFNTTYIYRAALSLTVTTVSDSFALYYGTTTPRIAARITGTQVFSASIVADTTGDVTVTTPTAFTATLSYIGLDANAIVPINSLVGLQFTVTSSLATAYDMVVQPQGALCSNDGSSCSSESVPYWSVSPVGPPTSSQLSTGGAVVPYAAGATSYSPCYMWFSFDFLPTLCLTTPSACINAFLYVSVLLQVNVASLPPGRRLLGTPTTTRVNARMAISIVDGQLILTPSVDSNGTTTVDAQGTVTPNWTTLGPLIAVGFLVLLAMVVCASCICHRNSFLYRKLVSLSPGPVSRALKVSPP